MIRRLGMIVILSWMMVQLTWGQTIQFNKNQVTEIETKNIAGVTLVPARITGQMLHLNVTWDSEKQQITWQDMGNTLSMSIGKKQAQFNGVSFTMPTEPALINGQVYIPFRAAVSTFGYQLTVDKNALILMRTLTDADKKILEEWADFDYHYGFIDALSIGEYKHLPIQEQKQEVPKQIKQIKQEIQKPETSAMLKVLGQECIQTLEYLNSVYNKPLEASHSFVRDCYVILNIKYYIDQEYTDIIYKHYPKELQEKEKVPDEPYDELMIKNSYVYRIKVLKNLTSDFEKKYQSTNSTGELLYHIGTVAQYRETFLTIKQRLRSQEAKKVVDTYIAYAEGTLAYYNELITLSTTPNIQQSQYIQKLKKLEQAMDQAYAHYEALGRPLS